MERVRHAGRAEHAGLVAPRDSRHGTRAARVLATGLGALIVASLGFVAFAAPPRADSALAGSPPVPAPGLGYARARTLVLHLRAKPERGALAAACAALGPGDLHITVRGRPLPEGTPVALDPEPRPVLHALLVDTSASMIDSLAEERRVAAAYLAQLRPGERALVATFDESTILLQAPTSDVARLRAALDGVRPGASTAMHDALHTVVHELARHRERPAIVLITDGVETASLHERDDVYAALEQAPELVVFTIGLDLPPLDARGPPGISASRRILQRLAARTHGEYFESPRAARLEEIFARIREALDREAVLAVADPEPEAEPPEVRVRSRRPGCHVRAWSVAVEPAAVPLAVPDASPYEDTIDPDPLLENRWAVRATRSTDDACSRAGWLRLDADGVVGCFLDVVLDYGSLYDPNKPGWIDSNDWIDLRERPLRVPLPRPAALPERPWQILDALSHAACEREKEPIESYWSRRPAQRHARPFQDHPLLANGIALEELRPPLARAMWSREDYREWARAGLREESARDLAILRERLGAARPAIDEAELDVVMEASAAARAIRERADAPSEGDVTRWLAAWHGDLAAHDAFVAWEREAIERWLDGERGQVEEFVERWQATRRLFWVPSYARILVPLLPARAPDGRIGFWRFLLPRPLWLQKRAWGLGDRSELGNLPLDLIPPLPLGLLAVERVAAERPDSFAGLVPVALRYELTGKAHKQDPRQAFESVEVQLDLAQDGSVTRVLSAEVAAEDGRFELRDWRFLPLDSPGADRRAEETAMVP